MRPRAARGWLGGYEADGTDGQMGRAIRYIVVVVALTGAVSFFVHISDVQQKQMARAAEAEAELAASPHFYIKPVISVRGDEIHFLKRLVAGKNPTGPDRFQYSWTQKHIRVLNEHGHTLFSASYYEPGHI
jgi:hypothetical protein